MSAPATATPSFAISAADGPFEGPRALALYRALVFPRLFEEKMLVLLRQGRLSKWFSGIGQEAIAVGVTAALQPDDAILPMHRNLGVFTGRGVDLLTLVRQLLGRDGGLTHGRDRTFHVGIPSHHIIGMISHLGAMMPVADGLALAYQLRGERRLAASFTGEGATSEGDFHEALNLAAVWKLPVLFVVENNQYGLSTPVSEQYACAKLSDRAVGYGMAGETVDGNDVTAVIAAVTRAAGRARGGEGPTLLEFETFRMRGHEEASGVAYVPPRLFEEWAKRDPILRFEERLLADGTLKPATRDIIRGEFKALIDRVVDEALASPEPASTAERELEDVFADKAASRQGPAALAGAASQQGPASPAMAAQLPSVAPRQGPALRSGKGPRGPAAEGGPASEAGPSRGAAQAGEAGPASKAGPRRRGDEVAETAPAGEAGPTVRYIDAISDALAIALERDPGVVLLGQDIAEYGGAFKVTAGMVEKFGRSRVRNTPIIESGAIGAAMGLALEGFTPMVELQFGDFISCGFNQVVNNLAKTHYRWGSGVGVVLRVPVGGGTGAGPFHSQNPEAWFAHVAGLKVVAPATPRDAKGLLLAAFEDGNPVLYLEHKLLYRSSKGPVPSGYFVEPIGPARVAREGSDITVVTWSVGVGWALEAAETLAADGVSVEVIDLRTLVPWDRDAVLASVKKTTRALVLHEAPATGGFGGEVAAAIGQDAFAWLDAPVTRVAGLDMPVPFSKALEEIYSPKGRLLAALREVLAY